jgi:hypothetical protein
VPTKPSVVLAQAHLNFPSFLRQRERVRLLDAWARGEQLKLPKIAGEYSDGNPYAPRETTEEYKDLGSRSPTPWAGLVVTSLAQTAYVDGVRAPGTKGNLEVWGTWQENGWDARQIPLHRDVIAHGLAFATAFPAVNPLTGKRTTLMRGVSAKEMAAFYDEDGEDEWPRFALRARPIPSRVPGLYAGWTVRLIDENATHYLSCRGDGYELDDWEYISYDEHNIGVPPVVRYTNRIDLTGRATGEIEPIIPLLRRIDQDTFDRLIVQRFGAWKVRYISGMAAPDGGPEAERAAALKLSIQDFLASGDHQTKFGTLDATDIDGFIKAGDTDLRYLAAVSQTPPHHLLGLSANLQAEALAAAEAGLQRKSGDFRTLNGESHEQYLRLVAHVSGNTAEASMFDMQVRWRDTESRSFAQTAQALSVVATGLKVPVEMLWERLPGWTDADSTRAKDLVESGAIDALILELEKGLPGSEGSQSGATDANSV